MDVTHFAIIVLSIAVLYLFIRGNKEHMTNSLASENEALANLASMYNSGNFIVPNLQVMGSATFSDNIKAETGILFGKDGENQWKMCTENSNNSLKLLPKSKSGSDFDTKRGIVLENTDRTYGKVQGQLIVNDGSRFYGDRHYFYDSEANNAKLPKPGLRVGTAYGKLGIYAENTDAVVGASSNKVYMFNNGDTGYFDEKGRHRRKFSNMNFPDGDLKNFQSSGPTDCINKCRDVNGTVLATINRNNECWCKGHIVNPTYDKNYDSYLML